MKEEKWSSVLPRHLGRGAEVLECVFEVRSVERRAIIRKMGCSSLFQTHQGVPAFVYCQKIDRFLFERVSLEFENPPKI